MSEYICPDCNKDLLGFLWAEARRIYFYCFYCRKKVFIENLKGDYFPEAGLQRSHGLPEIQGTAQL